VVKLLAGNKAIECKLVIFDKDGTLVDYRQVDLELAMARRKSVEKLAGKDVADFWARAVGAEMKGGDMDYCGPLGTLPNCEELIVAATAFYLKGCSWDEAKELAHKAYDDADGLMKPPYGSVLLEDVPAALRRLKNGGLKLAIASTYAHKMTIDSLRKLRVLSLFDALVGPEDVVNGKPAPDMVLEILKETKCKACDTVMVGDSVSDMMMGKNAEVKTCVGVLTGISQKKDLNEFADVVISSVAQLDVK